MKEDFLETPVNYAIVLRAELQDIMKLKEYLASLDEIHLIYQRTSFDKIYISTPSGNRRDESISE